MSEEKTPCEICNDPNGEELRVHRWWMGGRGRSQFYLCQYCFEKYRKFEIKLPDETD